MGVNHGEFERDMANPWDPKQLEGLQEQLRGEWGKATYDPADRVRMLNTLEKAIRRRKTEIKNDVTRVDDRAPRSGGGGGGSGSGKKPQSGVTLGNIIRFAAGRPQPPKGGKKK